MTALPTEPQPLLYCWTFYLWTLNWVCPDNNNDQQIFTHLNLFCWHFNALLASCGPTCTGTHFYWIWYEFTFQSKIIICDFFKMLEDTFYDIFMGLLLLGTKCESDAVWPDWAIFWTLGNSLKPLATINLPKSPTFFGNFCKGVKNLWFFSWNHFWATFIDFWRFFLVTLSAALHASTTFIAKYCNLF